MKSVPQPVLPNPHPKPAPPNASTCAQSASFESAMRAFHTLPKNRRTVSISRSKFSRSVEAKRHASNPFRMNTCESVSKQRTLTTFRINTYEKPRGRGWCDYRRLLLFCASAKWMTIFVCVCGSTPLSGICSKRIAPSGFLFNSAPSTRSIWAAFHVFNS